MSSNLDAYKTAFGKYATFDGRATVHEYWSFYLINAAAGLVLAFIVPALYVLFFLGVLLPALAVGVRRLHDQNRSAWYLLIGLIPFGVLVLLFWATQSGTTGSNDYGPDPLGKEDPSPLGAPEVVAQPKPVFQQSEVVMPPEVVKPSEGAVEKTEESPERSVGPKEMKEPMVDDDPELERLQKALAAAEQEIEQRLEKRREAEEQRLEKQRQAEEASNRKAETAKRISELASRLEEAEAKLSELGASDSREPTKALQKRCRCNTLVNVSSELCPNCQTHMGNQFQSVETWRCRGCEYVVGEHDVSCSNCEAVLYA